MKLKCIKGNQKEELKLELNCDYIWKAITHGLGCFLLLIIFNSCSENNPLPPYGDTPMYPSIDGFPSWSPDSKKIIYSHKGITHINPGGSYGINRDSSGLWMVSSDGTNPHLILKGTDINADWSSDGEWIVYETGAQIYKVPVVGDSADNNSIVQLTFEGRNFFPSLSPDRDWIAYDSNHDSPNGMNFIWKMKSDGSQKRRIAYEPSSGEIRMPDWSPDGEKIVHIRYSTDYFSSEIFLIDSTGEKLKRLTFNNATDYYPKYSHDGLKIIFESTSESERGIWIMDGDGNNQRRVISGGQPSWSPDGKKIVFEGFHAGTINDNGTIWTVDINGSNLKQITFGPR